MNINIYIIIILPVLYGCENWSLLLQVENWLRVFENRVLKKLFGPKRDYITRDWTELNDEGFHDL
jgi:hypothetical protein